MIKVWNMQSEQYVELKEYMRYVPTIWSNNIQWNILFPKVEK